MTDLVVGEELQDYLVGQLVGTLPPSKDAPINPALPSIWLAPRDGAPQPRAGVEASTVTIVDTLQVPAAALEAWIEETFVDVIVIATNNGAAKLVHRAIRNLLHPISAHGGRTQWFMGDLFVEYSTIWRGEQPLYQNDRVYARTASYRFGCRRKALAGTPDLP